MNADPLTGLNELTHESLEITKAVSEQGIQNVIAGVFIAIFILMVSLIVYQIVSQNKQISAIADYAKRTMDYIEEHSFQKVDIDRARGLVASELEKSKFEVIVNVLKIKQKNDIGDSDYIKNKIDSFIDKSFSNIIAILRKFTLHEKDLSTFIENSWKEKVKALVMKDCEAGEMDIQKIYDTYMMLFDSFKASFHLKIDEI